MVELHQVRRYVASAAAAALLPVLGFGLSSTADASDPGSTPAPRTGATKRAATAPRPLVWTRDFGDPTVVFDGEKWFGAATGFRARGAVSDYDWGAWTPTGDLLASKPAWAKYAGVWGPDIERGPDGWLAYYTMPSKGLPHEQDRCIGVATAPTLHDTFVPVSDRPLVCPAYSATTPANDTVPGRVGLPRRGVIDPASYIHHNGKRFLMYRTQGKPSTVRMVRLDPTGTRTYGRSIELIRDVGVLENPQMIEHGGYYYLITSRGDYDTCRYRTIWRRSKFRAKGFQGTRGFALMNRQLTGVCGPGGADYVEASAGYANRIFFHGWVCKGTNLPCYQSYKGAKDLSDVGKRALYAARLLWTRKGPVVTGYVQGPEAPPPVPTTDPPAVETVTPSPTQSPTQSPTESPTSSPTGTPTGSPSTPPTSSPTTTTSPTGTTSPAAPVR